MNNRRLIRAGQPGVGPYDPVLSHDATRVAYVGDDASVFGWGNNVCGQTGEGTTLPTPMPQPASGLRAQGNLTGGPFHSLAVGRSEQVWAWGCNGRGQLGTNTTSASLAPVPVLGLPSS